MRDIVANSATGALATSIGTEDQSLTLFPAEGLRFPLYAFKIQIDNEILWVAQRLGDVFTGLLRGQENTLAATHATNSYIVNCFTAGMLDHLWSVVPDVTRSAVPPAWRGEASNAVNDEFEFDAGTWTFVPNSSGSAVVIDTNQTPSHWHLRSTAWDGNHLYWKGWTAAPPWTISARLSCAQDLNNPTGVGSWFACLLVTDLAPPQPFPVNAGTQLQLGLGYGMMNVKNLGYRMEAGDYSTGLDMPLQFVRSECFQTDNANHQSFYMAQQRSHQVFSIHYDGQTATLGIGTGLLAAQVMSYPLTGFVPQSLGFYMNVNTLAGNNFHAYVDWLRVTYA